MNNTYDPIGGHTKEEADLEYNRLMHELHGTDEEMHTHYEPKTCLVCASPKNDLDSIVSAIAYAIYKNKSGDDHQYFSAFINSIPEKHIAFLKNQGLTLNFYTNAEKRETKNRQCRNTVEARDISLIIEDDALEILCIDLASVDSQGFIDKDTEIQTILINHNTLEPSLPYFDALNIVEIIDRHSVKGLTTNNPIRIQIERVGSTCTMIYEFFEQNDIRIPGAIASLLCAGILDSTKMFSDKSTDKRDKLAALALSNAAGIDLQKFYMEISQLK
jgi:inorganic pyrophosphatase/exopolyphosphatase